MPVERWRSLLRLFLIGVFTALPLACTQIVSSKTQLVVAPAYAMCSVGSQGCPCTAGGGCDPGLYCDGGVCVGDSYGDEVYLFEDDLMEAPAPMRAPAMDISRQSGRADRSERKASRKLGKSMGGMSAPEASASMGESAPSPDAPTLTPEPAEPTDPAAPADHGDLTRQVIYTAGLSVAVYELDAAADLTETLPQRYGGWIESRYDYQITLRIPAEHLFEAMDQLMALGITLDRTLLAQDVTGEYVDLESRILVLEQIVAQLEALLARAKDVEQALQIRIELDRIRLELEAARVRMRMLSELIDFSTLTVIFSSRTTFDQFPTSNDPFPWVDELGTETTEYR
jgi:hypothetical protein